MIHSSKYKPRVYDITGVTVSSEMDRIQSMSASISLNREKVEELGREGQVCYKAGTPTVDLSVSQMEYGSLEFYQRLANTADSDTIVTLADYKTSMVNIGGFATDDDDTFLGTVFYPRQRVASMNLSIGDPEALIERSFSLVGEDEYMYQNANKYVIELVDTNAAGLSHQIVIGSGGFSDYPTPVDDPDNSGTYFIMASRIRSGTYTGLTEGTDFTYDSGTNTITIPLSAASDTYKFWYTATTYISGVSTFTDNDSDLCAIRGDSVSVYLESTNYLYRLQSATIDVSFDRFDVREIGNKDIVARGINDTTISVALGRSLEDYTIEELLRNVYGESFGKIDIREFDDDLSLVVKIYSDNTKSTFKTGWKINNLAPISLGDGQDLNAYFQRDVTLESSDTTSFVTNSEGEL